MRTISLIALMAFSPGQPPPRGPTTAFPSYSRQDQAKACLSEYGMENTSILDCVARNKNYGSALSKIWAEIDDRFKQECLNRLADEHLGSYVHLDRCIRSLEKDAGNPD